ncbi:retropepsin-like aspartic protease [Psychroserpens sp. BH13MA-6]
MTKSILKITILLTLIVSCSPLKRLKTVTQGKVEQKHYLEEIPFHYDYSSIIIEVMIDGQAYNFMFDTGNDLTSIDNELISKINTKSNNVSNEISDARNIKSNNEYISIDNIKIGNIQFKNIGAQIFDHSPFEQVFSCGNKISGIIGSNLMRKAMWQIDYKNKVIRFTDRIEVFDLSNTYKFKTNSGRYGDAKIAIKLNGISSDYTFDTGYSGFISTNLNTFENLNATNTIQNTKALVTTFTANSASLEEKIYGYISNIQLGAIHIQNKIVGFGKNQSNLIGNEFLENYLVTLNWNDEIFYLKPVKEVLNNELSKYEYTFAPNYVSNKFSFFNQWEDHKLTSPIKLNSEIISINGIEVSNLTNEQLCDIWKHQKNDILTETVEIEILENEVKKKIALTKKQLLPK